MGSNMLSGLVFSLLLSIPALGAEVVKQNVTSISIEGAPLTAFKQESEGFYLQCKSKILATETGGGSLEIGDTVEFEGGSIHINFIEYIKYKEDQTVDYGGVTLVRSKGQADCIVIADEFNYPSDDRCLNIWLLVEGCKLIRE